MADRDVRVRLSASVAQYIASMQAAAEATDRVTASGVNMNRLGGTLQGVGRTMTLGVSAPIAAAGAAAVTMSNRFNTSFTRMSTLAGMSTSDLGRMRSAVLDLSRSTGRGPQELADALYVASSSGLNARQSLDAVTIAARGAASGLGSSEDIISLVASATASYGAANMDAATATDILVGTIREGRADPDELAGSLGRILPVAANLGVSFEEVGGSVAFLSNVFGDTDATITSLGDAMTKMGSPTEGGRQALEQYGSSMEKLHRIISEDGLLGAMRHLKEIGLSDDPLAFRAMFEDVQAQRGARAMIDNLGKLEEAIDGVKDSSGALEEAFSAAQGEEGFKMAQAWADIQVALVEFGDAIGPVAADIAGGVADIVSAFASLPEGVQMAIAGVLIAVGPLAMVAGTLMKHAKTIAAARALMLAPGPNIAGAAGVLPWWARGAGVVAAGVGVGVGLDALLGYVYSPNNWTGGRDTTPDRPAPPRRVGNWATDAQVAQADFWGLPTPTHYDPGWSTAGQGTPFTNEFSMTAPPPSDVLGPPSPLARFTPEAPISMEQASGVLAGVQSAGGGASMTPAAIAATRQEMEALVAATEEFNRVSRTLDWGEAALTGASAGLSAFNTQLFGAGAATASMEGSMDGLAEALGKVGTIGAGGLADLNLKTQEGREAFGALQQVAAAWQPALEQAVVAADGNVSTLSASLGVMREDFIAMAVDAGIGRTEAEALATAIGLIPENAETIIELSGQEEAKLQLGMLSGVIGNLQEDAQREMVMHLNNGDYLAALAVVMRELGIVPTSKSTTVSVVDNASGTLRTIRSYIDGLYSKTIYVTTVSRSTSGNPVYRASTSYSGRNPTTGGPMRYEAEGGYYDRATMGVYGEAGAEVILPLTRPDRMRQLLADARVMAPVAAAMGGMAAGSTGTSTAGSGATVRTQLVVQGSIYGVDHLNRVLDQRDRELARRLAVAR